MNNHSAVSAKDFRCRYGTESSLRLKNVSLEIKKGDFVAVIGSSGGGKSTLAFSINGIIPHEIEGSETGGYLSVLGNEVKNVKPHELVHFVGTVLQDPEWQLVTFTVIDEIAFGMENLGVPVPEIIARTEKLSALLGIEDLLNRSPDELSGGQKQRVAIASCLALEPPILLLDEPMAELDPIGKQTVLDTVVSLNKDFGVTVIFIDHNLDVLSPFADYVVVIGNGEVLVQGKPQEVLRDQGLLERIRLRPPQAVEISFALPPKYQPAEPVLSIDQLVKQIVPPDLEKIEYVREAEEPANFSPKEIVVQVKNLRYKYPDGPEAIQGISLDIHQGDFVGLIGQNGAGKSTLAKLMTGRLKPSQGNVFLKGDEIRALSRSVIAGRIGFVFQNPDYQFFSKTCFDEVAFGLRKKGWGEDKIESMVKDALGKLDVLQYAEEHPHFLSRGERRRVAIASVLALQPEIIILDEPTTGLDTGTATKMLEVVKSLHTLGHTIIMLTHEMAAVLEYCNRLILIGDGQVALDKEPRWAFHEKELLTSCSIRVPPVAEFIRALPWKSPPPLPRSCKAAAELFVRVMEAHERLE